jgi:hypothetical protein
MGGLISIHRRNLATLRYPLWAQPETAHHRKLLQSKAIAIENDLRGTLRNFGLLDYSRT